LKFGVVLGILATFPDGNSTLSVAVGLETWDIPYLNTTWAISDFKIYPTAY